MNAVIISQENFDEVIKRLDKIQQEVSNKQKSPVDTFIDNQEFIQIMNISKRTGQAWRDEGIISFSQIGSKIYYRMSDVQALLDKHYKPAFKK
ncbi:MAG: helix-turn-helix domain-containing protein [Saprospiraceae bacterium]|nr:helix-turn-helix domain-containing protein [Saprospiraceae bacterium]